MVAFVFGHGSYFVDKLHRLHKVFKVKGSREYMPAVNKEPFFVELGHQSARLLLGKRVYPALAWYAFFLS
jgi:hypothetical protein